MANYMITGYRYVDYDNGTDSTGYGLAMSTPYKTLGYASSVFPTATKNMAIICRRGGQEIRTANFTGTFGANEDGPNLITSWPRPASGYAGRFFQNTAQVDSIISANLTELGHEARFIIGPDGNKYLVAKVLNSNTMIIDPEYKGADATTNFTFLEDDLYSLLSTGITGADLQSTWDADTSNIYSIYFNGNYYWTTTISYCNLYNIAITGCIGPSYLMQMHGVKNAYIRNCVFKNKNDDASIWYVYRGRYLFDGCVFEGLNAQDTDQFGILSNVDELMIFNSVFTSLGGRGLINYAGRVVFDTVKAPLDGYYCYVGTDSRYGRSKESLFINCCFSGVAVDKTYGGYGNSAGSNQDLIINYNRVLGDERINWNSAGWILKRKPTSPGDEYYSSWDWLNLRPGGSDHLLFTIIDRSTTDNEGFRYDNTADSDLRNGRKVLEHQFIVPSGSMTLRYYVQISGASALTLDDIWLEVGVCPGTYWSPVNTTIYKSSGGINPRTSPTDWSQYIYISGLTVASGYVTSKLFYSKYATKTTLRTLIDPLPELVFV